MVNVSTKMLFVKVGVGTCKQLQMLDCCALLSPLKSAGWPLLMGTLDVLTELVLEVAFNEVLAFLLVVTAFLVLVDLLLVVLDFLVVNVTFLVLVVFLVDTAMFPRSFKSRLLIPALDSAAFDEMLANPADGAMLPVLVDVWFEKKVPLLEAVVLVEGPEVGDIEVC